MTERIPVNLFALASKAAQGAGFPQAEADIFGRAAVRHVLRVGDGAAVLRALRNPGDSPILRLPLILDDLLAACAALNGTAELTLNPDDADLAPSYAELLPLRLTHCEVVTRTQQPRLRIVTSGEPASNREPSSVVATPDPLLDRLARLAGTSAASLRVHAVDTR